MKIDFSIWGIRRGFEPAGFLHSHSYPDVLALQKDRYRNLSNSIGGQGFYLLQRAGSHFICTYIDTGVYEFVPNGSPRPGFVAFSLIIKDNFAFASSPRRVLEQLSALYRDRVGETQYNNFVEEDILRFLSSLDLVACHYARTDMVPAYAFYENAAEIDELLTGKQSYALHASLALIPGQKDESGNFKPNPYAESIFDSSPKILDLVSARLRSEQERQKEEMERQRIALENKNREIWKAEAAQFDPQLDNLLRQGKLEEARELVNQCRPELRKFLPSLTRLEEKEKEHQKTENSKSIAKDITKLETNGDLSAAHQLWKHNFAVDTYLSTDVRQAIHNYEQKIKNKETEAREKVRKEAERKKFLQISLMGILVTAVLGTGGYFGYQWYIQEQDIVIQMRPKEIFKEDSTLENTLPEDSAGNKDSYKDKPSENSKELIDSAKLKEDLQGGKVIIIRYPNKYLNKVKGWIIDKRICFKLNPAKTWYLWSKNENGGFEQVPEEAQLALNEYLGLNLLVTDRPNPEKQGKGASMKDTKKKSTETTKKNSRSPSEIENELNPWSGTKK